jgi:hypothetical protein
MCRRSNATGAWECEEGERLESADTQCNFLFGSTGLEESLDVGHDGSMVARG